MNTFKYVRHPLYAAFLDFFDFGLAVLLNNWIYIIWAVLLHPVWHLLINKEEEDLKKIFPGEYEEYCKNTGRFIPRIIKKSQ
jgi:protein-S-isoprenylcysteine O-methyltransferase Ste14